MTPGAGAAGRCKSTCACLKAQPRGEFGIAPKAVCITGAAGACVQTMCSANALARRDASVLVLHALALDGCSAL
eukprot:9151275-Alexandrium_andersonii.AAC.1